MGTWTQSALLGFFLLHIIFLQFLFAEAEDPMVLTLQINRMDPSKPVNIKLNERNFGQFHNCLCAKKFKTCIVKSNLNFQISSIVPSLAEDLTYSKTYMCEYNDNLAEHQLRCDRLELNNISTTVMEDNLRVSFDSINQSCELDSVYILWHPTSNQSLEVTDFDENHVRVTYKNVTKPGDTTVSTHGPGPKPTSAASATEISSFKTSQTTTKSMQGSTNVTAVSQLLSSSSTMASVETSQVSMTSYGGVSESHGNGSFGTEASQFTDITTSRTSVATVDPSIKPSTYSTDDVTTKASTDSTVDLNTKPSTGSTVDIVTKSSTDSSTLDSKTSSTSDTKTKLSTDSTVDVTTKSSTDSTVDITTKSSTDSSTLDGKTSSTTDTKTKPSTDSTVDLNAKSSTDSNVDITTKSSTDSSTLDSKTSSTSDTKTKLSTDSTVDVTTKSSTDSTIETKPSTSSTVDTKTKSSGSTVLSETISSTTISGMLSTQRSTTDKPSNHSFTTIQDSSSKSSTTTQTTQTALPTLPATVNKDSTDSSAHQTLISTLFTETALPNRASTTMTIPNKPFPTTVLSGAEDFDAIGMIVSSVVGTILLVLCIILIVLLCCSSRAMCSCKGRKNHFSPQRLESVYSVSTPHDNELNSNDWASTIELIYPDEEPAEKVYDYHHVKFEIPSNNSVTLHNAIVTLENDDNTKDNANDFFEDPGYSTVGQVKSRMKRDSSNSSVRLQDIDVPVFSEGLNGIEHFTVGNCEYAVSKKKASSDRTHSDSNPDAQSFEDPGYSTVGQVKSRMKRDPSNLSVRFKDIDVPVFSEGLNGIEHFTVGNCEYAVSKKKTSNAGLTNSDSNPDAQSSISDGKSETSPSLSDDRPTISENAPESENHNQSDVSPYTESQMSISDDKTDIPNKESGDWPAFFENVKESEEEDYDPFIDNPTLISDGKQDTQSSPSENRPSVFETANGSECEDQDQFHVNPYIDIPDSAFKKY